MPRQIITPFLPSCFPWTRFLLCRSDRCPSGATISMRIPSSGRANRPFAGALLVLLATGFLAPSPARASCGHGVTSRADRRLDHSASSLASLSEVIAHPTRSSPTVPLPARPCSGPSCSRRQGLPPSPTTVLNLGNESGCLTGLVSPSRGCDPAGELRDGLRPHPRLSTSPFERPPRDVA